MSIAEAAMLLLGSLFVAWMVGYGMGSNAQKKFCCRMVRHNWPWKKASFDDLGRVLGAIKGKPAEWCAAEAAEAEMAEADEVPLSEEDIQRYAKIAAQSATEEVSDEG